MRRSLAAVLALVAALGSAAGCSDGKPPKPRPSTLPSTSPDVVASPRRPLDGGPALRLPGQGAYVGAWVNPERDEFTQPGRIKVVDDFEHALGRPLDIVHTYRKWEDEFFTESDMAFVRKGAVLLFSWAGTDTRVIASGAHDELIRDRARRVRDLRRPILMEWRWEMDRPNLQVEVWSGEDYIKAWRHIRAIFDAEGVDNASWVWCPTSTGFDEGRAAAYYPGDDQVDWLCADVYPGQEFRPMGDLLRPFLQWANQHAKPIIIGEYGVPRHVTPDQRAAWLRDAASVFRANSQIKAVCYFEANPNGNKPPRQYLLRDDQEALRAFAEMARDPYFNPEQRTLDR